MFDYEDYDCENREEYLEYLSDVYSVSLENVKFLADLLGPDEDFDGLTVALEMGAV